LIEQNLVEYNNKINYLIKTVNEENNKEKITNFQIYTKKFEFKDLKNESYIYFNHFIDKFEKNDEYFESIKKKITDIKDDYEILKKDYYDKNNKLNTNKVYNKNEEINDNNFNNNSIICKTSFK